ncbi:LysM peptidoglycan-binding domain-containing protein [Loigolactobacillus coryniformis]|uniref:LysM peptidoglycan-binding domain-containing protein n=1 Tax=Loigolactobacillus coryniformis TaxID=1610 RepID=UPI002340642F|nr:LysM domain-containing protein [Loigolactobacillus coryniformis]
MIIILLSKRVKMLMFTTAGAAGLFLVGAQQAQAATVTAQSGDTVSELADKYGVSIDSIEKANGIDATTHLIFAGQDYEIPDGTDTTTVQAATTQTAAQATQAAQAQQQASAAQAQQAAATVQQAAQTQQATTAAATTTAASGSTYDQFIAAGGTAELWNTIVMPESGGNTNAVSPNGYHGLGQTKESWGYGSVASQTAGMLNYATSRYGSVSGAVAFRQSNGWW